MSAPYATVTDLEAYIVGGSGLSAGDAAVQLDRASWDIEQLLIPSIRGTTPPGVAAPAAPLAAVNPLGGNLNGVYIYRVTFVTATGETNGGTPSAAVGPSNQRVDLSEIPLGPAGFGVTARRIYRTVAGAVDGTQLRAFQLNDNVTTLWTDNVADAGLTGQPQVPITNTTVGRKIDIGQLSADKVLALNRATCAQTEYRIEMGEKFFVRAQYDSVSGPDFTTKGKLPRIGPKARQELAGIGIGQVGARASAGSPSGRTGPFAPGQLPYPEGYRP